MFSSTAHAQGTAFTYQGRLSDGAAPANGSYDLRFAVYNALSSGTQQGITLTNAATGVTNGLFTVPLDFGNVFPGAARWLEISVRTNGGGAFTTLVPRQSLTATPYAVTAGNVTGALPAAQLTGTVPDARLSANVSLLGASIESAEITDGTIAAADVNAVSFNMTFWRADGNAGTTPGTHFLGTTDNQPLELQANNQRALRLEPNANGAPNVIGGSPRNFVWPGVVGATIAGGGATNYAGSSYTNAVSGDFGTIGGGWQNTIQLNAFGSIIGGGIQNTIQNDVLLSTIGGGSANVIQPNAAFSTISGGELNTIQPGAANSTIGGGTGNTIRTNANYTTIGGGEGNTIQPNAIYSVIGGGTGNTIQSGGQYATIPGGFLNSATNYALAAGRRAKANHSGAFVWADSQNADFLSTTNNQFSVRAVGGVRLATSGAGLTVDGAVTATALSGGGANVTGLNANNLTSGTVPSGALSGSYANPVSFSSELTASGGLRLHDAALWLRGGSDTFHGLRYSGGSSPFAGQNPDGPVLFGWAGGVLGSREGGEQAVLSWKSSGNVGVGTNNPTARLHVSSSGNDSAPQGWFNQENAGDYSRVRLTAGGDAARRWDIGARSNRFAIYSGLAGQDVLALDGAGLTVRGTMTMGTNFLGTTVNQPVEFKVNNQRALRLEPNTNGAPNVIGGAPFNFVAPGVYGATIAGGGATNFFGSSYTNSVSGIFSTIGGGERNTIQQDSDRSTIGGGADNTIQINAGVSTIGGGWGNTIQSYVLFSTIGGGLQNTIQTNAQYSTLGGGSHNTIQNNAQNPTIGGGWFNTIQPFAHFSTIGGGWGNTIGGTSSTIPGGYSNNVAASYAFAAGNRAKANHQGAFVWGDSSNADIATVAANSVTFRAAGGYRLYSNAGATAGVSLAAGGTAWGVMSDRNVKKDFAPVDAVDVLEKLAALPITQWRYQWEEESHTPRIGPMAQDFKAAFYPGTDDKTITTQEADGVALAAIQGLNLKLTEELKRRDAENAELKQTVNELKKLVQTMNLKLNGGTR